MNRFATFLVIALGLVAGCRSVPKQPALNFSEPGWDVGQGQAVWRTSRDAPEIAGDLLVARHRDGRTFVQFTKPPIPFAVAQRTARSWWVDFPADRRSHSGEGNPPGQILWLHLPDALAGVPFHADWQLIDLGNGSWRFENSSSGELLEGFLQPSNPR
jgi:hypothetical protein